MAQTRRSWKPGCGGEAAHFWARTVGRRARWPDFGSLSNRAPSKSYGGTLPRGAGTDPLKAAPLRMAKRGALVAPQSIASIGGESRNGKSAVTPSLHALHRQASTPGRGPMRGITRTSVIDRPHLGQRGCSSLSLFLAVSMPMLNHPEVRRGTQRQFWFPTAILPRSVASTETNQSSIARSRELPSRW